MIPLTNKEEIKPKHLGYADLMRHGKYISLYGAITTLLLPLTVQVIGGQYGVLVFPYKHESMESNMIILPLTDMSVLHEVVLISLLFFAHLIGFIGVIKKWAAVLLFYSFVRFGESVLYFSWFISVTKDHIKSHVMSQIVLGWYCFFAFIIELVFTSIIHVVTIKVIKCKKE